LKWCVGNQPHEVNFGHLYHVTAMTVNGINTSAELLNDKKKLPFKLLFDNKRSWANADKVAIGFVLFTSSSVQL